MRPFSRLTLLLALAATAACHLYVVPEDARSSAAVLNSLLGDGGGSGTGSTNYSTSCLVNDGLVLTSAEGTETAVPANTAAFTAAGTSHTVSQNPNNLNCKINGGTVDCGLLDYSALFTDTGATLTGVGDSASYGVAEFADVDGDGDQDLLVAGDTGGSRAAKIYKNDGTGNFTEHTGAGLTAIENGSGAFGDIDGDGDPDLILVGDTTGSDNLVATLYKNDGAGNFSDTGAVLTGVKWSTSDFVDVDGDGDLDLIITGTTGGISPNTTVYTNDGAGNFTGASNRGLDNSLLGALDAGDVDGDGDPDILLFGHNGTAVVGKLFKNDGAGNFTVSGAALAAVIRGSALLTDLDGDGDLDAVLTGNFSGAYTTVYKNDGNGNFTPDTNWSGHVSDGSAIAGDVDKDGDVDLLFSGTQKGPTLTTLFVNRGDGTFIRTEPGPSGLKYSALDLADIDGDGDLDLVNVGEGPAANVYRNNLGTAIDLTELDCNVFEPTTLFSVQATGLPNLDLGDFEFGDIDNDGDLDLLTMGRLDGSTNDTRIWRRTGDYSFVDTGSAVTDLANGEGTFGDVDGDGDIDLVISGEDAGGTRYTDLYRNDGTGLFSIDAVASAAIQFIEDSSVTLVDLDGDSDLDLFLQGTAGAEHAKVYDNDGTGSITLSLSLIPASNGDAQTADLDNDGDQDLIYTGYNNPGPERAYIYRNDGGLAFTNMSVPLTPVYRSHIEIGDLDGDGDIDIVIAGYNSGNGVTKVYRNDGGFTFTDIGAAVEGVMDPALEIADIDDDGDLDLIVIGQKNGSGHPSGFLYLNDGAMNFTRVNVGLDGFTEVTVDALDFDGDGDMDLIFSGNYGAGTFRTLVLRNNMR